MEIRRLLSISIQCQLISLLISQALFSLTFYLATESPLEVLEKQPRVQKIRFSPLSAIDSWCDLDSTLPAFSDLLKTFRPASAKNLWSDATVPRLHVRIWSAKIIMGKKSTARKENGILTGNKRSLPKVQENIHYKKKQLCMDWNIFASIYTYFLIPFSKTLFKHLHTNYLQLTVTWFKIFPLHNGRKAAWIQWCSSSVSVQNSVNYVNYTWFCPTVS